jgi:hypothetical protein
MNTGRAVDDQLRKLINCIFEVHSDTSIDCEQCCNQFNCLVELVTDGADISTLLPAVQEHLSCCADCREEFQALMSIIEAENQGLQT